MYLPLSPVHGVAGVCHDEVKGVEEELADGPEDQLGQVVPQAVLEADVCEDGHGEVGPQTDEEGGEDGVHGQGVPDEELIKGEVAEQEDAGWFGVAECKGGVAVSLVWAGICGGFSWSHVGSG